MSWERRLLEMVLAGGAVAAAACGGNETAAQNTTEPDASVASPFCCNGASDPCSYRSGDPDASITPACERENDCLNAGGTIGPDGVCDVPSDAQPLPAPEAGSPDAETPDGGPVDAGPADAAEDVTFSSSCCNANPNPCCPMAYCSGGVGPDAAVYLSCEQNRTQCESKDGFYETQPDGSVGCTPLGAGGH